MKRELDQCREQFLKEEALRGAAYLARFDRIEKDHALHRVESKEAIATINAAAQKVADDVHDLKLTLAKYFGGGMLIVAFCSAALTGGLRYLMQ